MYDHKFRDVAEEEDKTVLVVEMGHARSSVSNLKKVSDNNELKESKEDLGDTKKSYGSTQQMSIRTPVRLFFQNR